jgi:hypothetical protein
MFTRFLSWREGASHPATRKMPDERRTAHSSSEPRTKALKSQAPAWTATMIWPISRSLSCTWTSISASRSAWPDRSDQLAVFLWTGFKHFPSRVRSALLGRGFRSLFRRPSESRPGSCQDHFSTLGMAGQVNLHGHVEDRRQRKVVPVNTHRPLLGISVSTHRSARDAGLRVSSKQGVFVRLASESRLSELNVRFRKSNESSTTSCLHGLVPIVIGGTVATDRRARLRFKTEAVKYCHGRQNGGKSERYMEIRHGRCTT